MDYARCWGDRLVWQGTLSTAGTTRNLSPPPVPSGPPGPGRSRTVPVGPERSRAVPSGPERSRADPGVVPPERRCRGDLVRKRQEEITADLVTRAVLGREEKKSQEISSSRRMSRWAPMQWAGGSLSRRPLTRGAAEAADGMDYGVRKLEGKIEKISQDVHTLTRLQCTKG